MASLRTAKRKAQRRRRKAWLAAPGTASRYTLEDFGAAIVKAQYSGLVAQMLSETSLLYDKFYRR